jgi:preprotein translocase subunit SecG
MKWTIALLVGFGVTAVGFKYAGWLLSTFFVLNCLVLIIVVLLQSGKAADLAGAFGGAGSQTAFGPRGAANVLSKATTWCAVMFMVCAFALVLRVDKSVEQGTSVLQNIAKPAPAKTPTPAPVTTPAPVVPAPQTSIPQSNTPPATSQPATSQPTATQPAATQPAPQPKKP